MMKMCRKKAKKRQVFLFNDIFVYANVIIADKKFNKQTIIPLEQIRVLPLEDDACSGFRNGWQVCSPMKSFILFASTSVEKHNWIKYISVCRQKLLASRNSISGLPQSSPTEFESSPVWVPDSEASICMHCRKSQFNFINRRHHCRKCGIVCCSNCSEQKFLLPNLSSKPVRVCRTCFNKLTISSLQNSMHGNPLSDSLSDSDSDEEKECRWNPTEQEKSESLFYSELPSLS